MLIHLTVFFSEIADEIRSQIPDTSAKPEDYLEDLDSNFEFLSTNPVEVSEIISSLNRKNTLDIDCVSTVLIKAVSTEISEPLSHIFNLSFSTGPIPINLNPENLTNYRPISCLPAFSKVIEKIVFKQLYNYLSINYILYKNQFGFQPVKSTFY